MVLDNLVFWPLGCIRMKPGERCQACQTRAVSTRCSSDMRRAVVCTRGMVVPGSGAYPSGTPWYGSGLLSTLHFPLLRALRALLREVIDAPGPPGPPGYSPWVHRALRALQFHEGGYLEPGTPGHPVVWVRVSQYPLVLRHFGQKVLNLLNFSKKC